MQTKLDGHKREIDPHKRGKKLSQPIEGATKQLRAERQSEKAGGTLLSYIPRDAEDASRGEAASTGEAQQGEAQEEMQEEAEQRRRRRRRRRRRWRVMRQEELGMAVMMMTTAVAKVAVVAAAAAAAAAATAAAVATAAVESTPRRGHTQRAAGDRRCGCERAWKQLRREEEGRVPLPRRDGRRAMGYNDEEMVDEAMVYAVDARGTSGISQTNAQGAVARRQTHVTGRKRETSMGCLRTSATRVGSPCIVRG